MRIKLLLGISIISILTTTPGRAVHNIYTLHTLKHAALTSSNTYIHNYFSDHGTTQNSLSQNVHFISDNRLYFAQIVTPFKIVAMLPLIYKGSYHKFLRADAYGIGDTEVGLLYTHPQNGSIALITHLPTGDADKELGTGLWGGTLAGILTRIPRILISSTLTSSFPAESTSYTCAGYYKWFAWTGIYATIQTSPTTHAMAWRGGFKILQSGQGAGASSMIYTLWSDLAGKNTPQAYGFTLGILY